MSKILNYTDLTDEELAGLNKEKAVVFLPLSPLEAHGPHLPLGTDFLMAGHLAKVLAERLVRQNTFETALLLPAVPLGAGGIRRTGTIEHGVLLIEQVIVEYGEHLSKYGFKKGIIVSGHAGERHLKAMSNASEVLKGLDLFNFLPLTSYLFSAEGLQRMKTALKDGMKQNSQGTLPPYDGHAGAWETSMALVFLPELVSENYRKLPVSENVEINGYRGNPALATAELGQELKEFLLRAALAIITEYF